MAMYPRESIVKDFRRLTEGRGFWMLCRCGCAFECTNDFEAIHLVSLGPDCQPYRNPKGQQCDRRGYAFEPIHPPLIPMIQDELKNAGLLK